MARAYVYDMVDTWNAGATTFTAIKMNVTDTASAAASLLMDLQVGGSSKFSVSKLGVVTASTNILAFGLIRSYSAFQLDADTILARDAANTLAQRNGVNAQTFRVYNTYTDVSNYERIGIYYDGSGTNRIWMERAGTGGPRNLSIGGDAITLQFGVGATVRWQINASGHFLANADNTYDIGASGASRPRNVYVAGGVTAGSSFECGSGDGFVIASRAIIRSFANGTIQISNAASNDFNRLQFGGTTSSFPALKRNGTAIETKLADDSAYAPHAMQFLDVTDGITAPASATGRARIYVDTADGDLKVIFADGTIKTIVTDT